MNNPFNEEAIIIKQIEDYLSGLNPQKINILLNKEYFYNAKHELPELISTQPDTLNQLLAKKILDQLTEKADYDQIIDQVQHRLKIVKNDDFDQKEECKRLFSKESEQIRTSGAKLKDFLPLFHQEVQKAITLDNPLTNKTVQYFQNSIKDKPLQDVLSDLIDSIDPPESPNAIQPHLQQSFDESTRAELGHIIEQLKLVQNIFNFQ